MNRKILMTAAVALLLATSCEKELDIDYHTTDPHYVAEVLLTPDGATARLTTTRDMTVASAEGTYVDHAVVTVQAAGDTWTDTLVNRGRGLYQIISFYYEDTPYVVDISIDGKHYTATSTMRSAPQIASFGLVWQELLSEKILFADLRLNDAPDQNNYYFMHLYRNGVGYRWAVCDDKTNPGGELQQLFSCTTKTEQDKGTDSDVLHEGDALRMEVRSIDRPVYDYFRSLELADAGGSNPTSNFTGGMLGYFSACQQAVATMVFHTDSIRDADR